MCRVVGEGRRLVPKMVDRLQIPCRCGQPGPERLGEHTDAVLSQVLGLPDGEIARLRDAGIAAGPERS